MADEKTDTPPAPTPRPRTEVVELDSAQFAARVLVGTGSVTAVSSSATQKLFLRGVNGVSCVAIVGVGIPRYVPVLGCVVSFTLKSDKNAAQASQIEVQAERLRARNAASEERRNIAKAQSQTRRDNNRARAGTHA